MGAISPLRLEYKDTLTAALGDTFWLRATGARRLPSMKLVMPLSDV